jgi:rhamnopyranosyl-N-acetylglucosaminyl-diphospho-decaprenol beta-1,3/1,4-galactofuranosyltransferase
MNRETVAAVVVTFNRKQLLTECLDALLAQGRPVDRIFVIDNASSDGTPELLEERGYLESPSIYYISLPENVGGAGGFYEGMKRGYDAGFDWLWVMDDDGRPTQNALDVLLNSSELQGTRNRAPLVVSDLDNLTLTFGVHYRGGIVKSIDEISDTTVEDANYFLGNLFHRSIIERAGYPKKEMFIWGDETEFRLRLERHNFFPVSSVNAIFFLGSSVTE